MNGQPAAGVALKPENFGQAANVEGNSDILLDDPPNDSRTAPAPVTTDDLGRFVFKSLGRGHYVGFTVDDARYAPQGFRIAADAPEGSKDVTQTLVPARFVEGCVVAADTGQGVPGTVISIPPSRAMADSDGRFRVNVASGDPFGVVAYPPSDQPYTIAVAEVVWTKGQINKQLDIKLARGVVIRGKVTEQGTGRPLAGSSILFVPVKGPAGVESKWDSTVPSAEDGFFRIVVPPGKGHLLVFGPTSDYVHKVIGRRTRMEDLPGGERWYAHAIIPYEVKAGDVPQPLAAELHPGKTLRARVVGSNGEPVPDAVIITRLHIEPVNPFWQGGWSYQHRVRDGYFELHGLDPEKSALVYILDAEHDRAPPFWSPASRPARN